MSTDGSPHWGWGKEANFASEYFGFLFRRFKESKVIVPNKRVKFDFGADGKILLDGFKNEVSTEDAAADSTIIMNLMDFRKMALGTLDPTDAYMKGKIRVDGDMSILERLKSIVDELYPKPPA